MPLSSQRSRFLPPSRTSSNTAKQQHEKRQYQYGRLSQTITDPRQNQPSSKNAGGNDIKLKTEPVVVINQEKEATSMSSSRKLQHNDKSKRSVNAVTRTAHCIPIEEDGPPATKVPTLLRDNNIISHGVTDGSFNPAHNNKIKSRCRQPIHPPLQRTVRGEDGGGKEIASLDGARGLASRQNAPSAPSDNETARRIDQRDSCVYEFLASPPVPGRTRGSGKKSEMTGAETSVVRTLLKGHEEFIDILHRRTKLREKMTLRGISYRPVQEDDNAHLKTDHNASVILCPRCDVPNNDDTPWCNDYDHWGQSEKHEDAVLTLTADVHPCPRRTPGTSEELRSKQRSSIDNNDDDGQHVLDGDVGDDCGASGDRTIEQDNLEDDDNGSCVTSSYVPTFLSLISEMADEE